jgi:hypothetical protein
MISQRKYSAAFTMDETANACTETEIFSKVKVTALGAIPIASPATTPMNLANFAPSGPLNDLAIVAKGGTASAAATLLFSAHIYVAGALTDVDVYRLT